MLTLTSPIETPLHRVPAGAKLAGLALGTMLILPLRDPLLIGVAVAVVAALHLAQGLRFARSALHPLRIVWPFVAVLLVWHGITGDLAAGGGLAARMVAAVALANLVTMTTPLSAMIAVLERLARPLAVFGLRPQILALAVALVIRFTPVLMAKASDLALAWRARSRRRAGWRLVVPMTLVALDDAEHVAEALRARGGL